MLAFIVNIMKLGDVLVQCAIEDDGFSGSPLLP